MTDVENTEHRVWNDRKLIQFMRESNRIERERRINPGDLNAARMAINTGIDYLADILNIHSILGRHLNKKWVGKLREVDVRVGPYTPPSHEEVPKLMEKYCADLMFMDSWTAHNEFQKIHPFRDLNGRVGRLIWLARAVEEGYKGTIPFLQMYYYQTLEKFEDGKIL